METGTFRGLALAGTAFMGAAGGRAKSANAVIRSTRARRRGFDKEADVLRRTYEREHGPVEEWPTEDDEIAAKCQREPAFAEFVAKMERLSQKWFG